MFIPKGNMRGFVANSREIIVLDQNDNLNNSKESGSHGWRLFPLAFALLLGGLMANEAMGYRPGLTGRLHHGLVPGILVGVLVLSGLGILLAKDSGSGGEPSDHAMMALCPEDDRAVSARIILSCLFSIGVFAALARPLGVPATVFLAVLASTGSVAGMFGVRRLAIAGGIAALSTGIFVILLRLPLPVLPGGRFW
jgi:hypothetical protein